MKKNIQPWALFLPEIKELISEKKFPELKKLLKNIHPIDLTEGWVNFTAQEKLLVFKLLDSHRAVEVFEELDFDEQAFILNNLEDSSISEILEDMASDEKAKLFKNLPDRIRKKMTVLLKKEDVEIVRKITAYPDGTAGKLMSTDFITLSPHLTTKQALEKIQISARLHKVVTIYVLYVLDDKNNLIGGVTLRRLIAAPQDIKISEIMSPVQLIKIIANTDQEDVAKKFSKYDLTAAPVVDDENRLIGVITIDDVVDVIQDEATEDIAKMGGTSKEEFQSKSIFETVKIRMPWLLAAWFGGVMASWIIGVFEDTLKAVVVLAAFIPVVIGMGGNIGMQSSTIVIRGLAVGQIDVKMLGVTVFRELRIGLLLGLIYGILLGVFVYFLHGNEYKMLGLVVGGSICASMTLAATTGTFLPMIFKKIKIDPAVATGPFVTTLIDIFGVLIYFFLATVFFIK